MSEDVLMVKAMRVLLTGVVLISLASCADDDDALPPPDSTTALPTTLPSTTVSSTTVSPTTPPPTTRPSSTTVADDDPCAIDPGPIANSPLTTPSDANTQCDAEAGWRMFFWIGESGDPIYRVQRIEQDAWVDVDHDVACGLDTSLLVSKGVPSNLAEPWGDRFSGQCG